MSERPRKFAFVSGKGGVGKTLLAANFSFYSSTNRKTVLIDLDFQNQGASGLLADYIQPGCMNAFDLLAAESIDIESIVKVKENLFFVPAFDPSKSDRFASQPASSSFELKGVLSLAHAIDRLIEIGNFAAVIIDCHGGLDDSSFAAFIYSDTTFIVTEPDKVTFSGTLELFDFYIGRANAVAAGQLAARPPDNDSNQESSIGQRIAHIENNKVRFLVNRVSGKLGHRTLKEMLSRQFNANFEIVGRMNQGFSFFPTDPILSESFSEYPFFVELLPEAVFSQKMEFLCHQVFGITPNIKSRSRLYKIFERISPSKIDAYLNSPYETRVQAVFSFVGLFQVLFSLIMVVGVFVSLLGIGDFFPAPSTSGRGANLSSQPSSIFSRSFGGIAICFTILLFYLVRFNFLISGFFRDRLRYEWRLYLKNERQASVVFLLRIIRAFSFRFALVVWAWLYFLAGIMYAIFSLLLLSGVQF